MHRTPSTLRLSLLQMPDGSARWARATAIAAVLASATIAPSADAQTTGAAAPAGEPTPPSEGALEPPANPAEPSAGSNYSAPSTGGAGGPDLNSGLGASDRPLSAGSEARDGFDLGGRGAGSATVRGSATGAYVVSGSLVPELHGVKRGDTLWEISGQHFGNSYYWPRIWAFNPQIQNPHWLYPGDQVRLRESQLYERGGLGIGLSKLTRTVSPDAVFQRFHGFVLDDKHPKWGEVVGSPEDQMILTHEDGVYIKLEGNREYRVGQKLVVFEPIKVQSLSEDPFVWIRGIIQIDRLNATTKVARARILDSITEIERGAFIGPFDETMDVIEPVPNEKTVSARIVGALYPYEMYVQHQVVFIDKGSDAGLKVGNRFFAVGRGDPWRRDLGAVGASGSTRATIEDDAHVRFEETPPELHGKDFPVETYGELIVTRVRKHTAVCLITAMTRELPRGAVLVAREGY
ncbi:MAG: LysM peptidoglycan-binding domain-containing protein [Myxococcales bacterium]|nr:LysM peptidoglycan-binding domain-containing protein [Myxococcales bacterium]